jgi:hypothetical protein
MSTKPKIRDDKTRLNITLPKIHKAHLEEIANDLGVSLNSLIVSATMEKYPLKK